MRIKLVVSYDGADYRGWAAQTGQRTVQGTLTEAVRRVSGEGNEITGASRTDSGAHAIGQVCHFDSEVGIPPIKWADVLNRVLPLDLAVRSSQKVSDGFHSRFSAEDRWYRYRIHTGPPDVRKARFVHRAIGNLDLGLMRQAAASLEGDHDFLAFTEELEPSVENTRRELFSVKVAKSRDEVWVDVVGTAFLRGMMRRISGALLEVGRRRRPVEEVSRLLDPEERRHVMWPVVLPARGLCLMQVRYARPPRDHRLPRP